VAALSTAAEPPEGLIFAAEVISQAEERELVERFEAMRFDSIVIRGQAARRTARHFGLSYDYKSRAPQPGEPMPGWLDSTRQVAAELAGVGADDLVEVLVQRYPEGATIGWHRDAPAFGIVVGISLLGAARLRLARGRGKRRQSWELRLEPRSGYVLDGEARRVWEHSIPPAKKLRYSVTYRTLH
jgi:DNA oxidative demethylase